MQQQPQWVPDNNTVPVPIIISEESAAQVEAPTRPERITPVVSALTQGPTVEISHRPQREQFPVLGKGHQQQSPVKRKQQRSEQSQEQTEVKVKDQQQQQQSSSKVQATQSTNKHKSTTTTTTTTNAPTDSKKHQQQTPQDSDEYVQSVQTKTVSEPKTMITIKKNDNDNSGTKTKSDDSLKNKENNNLETRNLENEKDVVHESNCSKSENVKCDVVSKEPKDRSPVPPSFEEPSGKKSEEEEKTASTSSTVSSSSSCVPEPEVVPAPAEDNASLKTNGDVTTEEEGKSKIKRILFRNLRLEGKVSK